MTPGETDWFPDPDAEATKKPAAAEKENDVDELDDLDLEGGDEDFDAGPEGAFADEVPDIDEEAAQEEEAQAQREAEEAYEGPPGAPADAVAPPTEVVRKGAIDEHPSPARTSPATAATDALADELLEELENYGVKDVTVLGTVVGQRVTRYELELAPGTRMGAIAGLGTDLAYALGATDVKIIAPLPGRRAVGVEIPNERGDDVAPPVDLQESTDPPPPYYASLERFLNEYLFPLYRREIRGTEGRWCDEWWKHEEAVARFNALWHAWEALRLEPGLGPSAWLRDHCDHHMGILLSDDGPFRRCVHGKGEAHGNHKHELLPVLTSSLPPGLLDEAAS